MHISTYHIYSIVSCGLLSFVFNISCGLHFLFLYLMERFRSVLFNLFVIVEPLIYFRVCHGTLINKNLKYTNYL